MKTHTYSDAERALLTEEELAGMDSELDEAEEAAAGDDDGANPPVTESAAGAADPPPAAHAEEAADGDGEEEEGDEPVVAAPEAAPAADPLTIEDVVAAQPDLPAPFRNPSTEITKEAYEEADAAIKQKLSALETLREDGDIGAADYAEKLRELNREAARLDYRREATVVAEEQAAEFQRQQVAAWGTKTVPGFIAQHPEYNANSGLMIVLDRYVREAQASSSNKLDPAHLAAAHARVAKDFPGVFKAPGKPPQTPNNGKRALPPSIAHLPAAEPESMDGDDSEFAHLDRLADTNPLAYEGALKKLSANEGRYAAYMAR